MSLPPNATQAFDLVDTADYDAIDSAIYGFQQRCVAAKGLQAPPVPDYDSGSQLRVDAQSFGATTEEQARRVGLKTGPLVTVASAPKGPGVTAALAACQTQAMSKLDSTVTDTRNSFLQLLNDLTAEFQAKFQPSEDSVLVKERQCVAAAGWTPTSADAVKQVETVGPAQLFGVTTATPLVNSTTGVETYVPQPREIDLALAFVKCRNQLGTVQQSLSAAKSIQLGVVGRNDARIRQQNSDIAAASRAAIDELK